MHPNPDRNCLNYADFKCIACMNNLVLSADALQCMIQFCQFMNPSGICAQCITGYNLTAGGSVCTQVVTIANCDSVINGACARCSNGYYINLAGQCDRVRANNCQTYNPSNGLCLNCPPAFNLAPDSYCMETTCRISNGGICLQCI